MRIVKAVQRDFLYCFTVHLDERRTLEDGSPDPGWVAEVQFGTDMQQAQLRQELKYWAQREVSERQAAAVKAETVLKAFDGKRF